MASTQEVLLLEWWCGGRFARPLFGARPEEDVVPHDEPFFASPRFGGFALWTLAMFYVRIGHFYVVHRAMHPWFHPKSRFRRLDAGRVLYKHVHAHHHKSHNPTAFSGISMTPVESVLYFTAALVPLLFRSGSASHANDES